MKIGLAPAGRVGAEALRRALQQDRRLDLAWSARGADEAISLCRSAPPDLLLIDVETRGAVELTRRVMTEAPCAILLVTSDKAGSVSAVFDALGHGALDVVEAPTLDMEGQLAGAARLLARIATVAKLIGWRDAAPAGASEAAAGVSPGAPAAAALPLVAIGASTGGPQALAAILGGLPRDLHAGIVIVQHIDEGFAPGLASWLVERAGYRVELGKTGDAPRASVALLAASGDHVVMRPDRRLTYVSEPADHLHRPSVDVFFASLAAHAMPGMAVLLTGMGRDGADGLLRLRRAGWSTVSQDESTSVVYGMPKAAAELGAAEQILPLEAIASTIAAFASRAARKA